MELLLEADPSKTSVENYLKDSRCYSALRNDKIVGVCVLKNLNDEIAEIFNIAIEPSSQGQGIGGKLLEYVIQSERSNGFSNLELGTGAFGHQLLFYQRQGFRVVSVLRNHFIDNYPEPIFESGVQHQDMLRLELKL